MTTQLALPLTPGTKSRGAPRLRASIYQAGAHTRRTAGWHAPTSSPNHAIIHHLTTLRDRSRQAVRNDGFAKSPIDVLVSNVVGTGIQPLPRAEDEVFRREAAALWLRWTDEADADGLLDFYGLQALAVRCTYEAGEAFIRLRPRRESDGLSVPLQIQVIEPELCPHYWNTTAPNGNPIRAGIEFNGIGQRVAYWFHPSRPADDLLNFDRSDLRRVPASSVVHLFEPLRAGQIRGVPMLTQALIRLHELDKYDDATLLRQQLANLFTGFLKNPSALDSTLNPLTGLVADDTREDREVVRLEPGMMQEISGGEEIEWSDPPDPPQTYPDFVRTQLRAVGAATGVPYELFTGDMTGLNDRVMRVLLGQFRRKITAWQHQIVAHKLCRPIWHAWLDRVFLAGLLPIGAEYAEDPAGYRAVKWMPQGWPYLHPVQDVQAQSEAIRAGFTSRSAVVAETGEDAEQIDEEQAADNDRADRLGLKYESDGRQKKAKAAGAPPKPPSSEPDPDDPEGDDPETEDEPADDEPPAEGE